MNHPQYPQGAYIPPQKQGMSAGKIILIIFASIAFLGFGSCVVCGLVVGAGVNAVEEDRKEKEAQTEEQLKECVNADVVEWETIAEALEENEAKVVASWKGNCVKVNGVVNRIDSSAGDKPVVDIGTGKTRFKSLRCRPRDHDKALELTKGQSITVWGIGGDEMLGTLYLEHCDW